MSPQPVQLHRESNSFVFANPHLALRFSISPPGSLISLSSPSLGVEVLHPPLALAYAESWRFEFPATCDLPAVGSRKAENFTYDFLPQEEGDGRLEMRWHNLLLPNGELPAVVNLSLLLPAESPLCFCRISAELPPAANPAGAALLFPLFSGLRPPDPEGAGLFLPLREGLLIPNPGANLAGLNDWLYPGELTMQFAGLRMLSHNASLYLAAHDSGGTVKGFRAGLDEQGNLTLGLLNFPVVEADGRLEVSYQLAFGILPGDWWQVARIYRGWASQQAWRRPAVKPKRPLVPLVKSEPEEESREDKFRGLWLLNRGGSQQVAPAAKVLQREANEPVRVLWQWWHGCPGDSRYPSYLPPRDGEESFTRVVAQLKQAGIPAWLGIDISCASPRSPVWELLNLRAHAALSASGGLQEVESNPLLEEPLMAMCPTDGEWLSLLNKICKQMLAMGAAGAWLERTLPNGAGLRCFAAEHPHPAGTASFSGGKTLPCPAVASNPPEILLGQIEAGLFTGASAERGGRPRGVRGDNWEPIPLLQAVYAPGLRLMGLVGPLSNIFPRDPLWGEPTVAPRAGEQALLREEYVLQFTLEAARTLLWGYLPALSDFDSAQLKENSCLRKLAFLRALLQLEAMEPVTGRGEFLGPVSIDCQSVEVDFLVNSLYSQPGQRRVFTRQMPAVLATAWRNSQGRVLLLLVNLREHDTNFACKAPFSRLGIISLGKVYGLTFSPELGGRPARLGLAESEVSGQLPPHSASIIWL